MMRWRIGIWPLNGTEADFIRFTLSGAPRFQKTAAVNRTPAVTTKLPYENTPQLGRREAFDTIYEPSLANGAPVISILSYY
jgi:hypothetical protein